MEYEVVPHNDPSFDPEALLVAWVHTEPPSSVYKRKNVPEEEKRSEFTHPFRVTMHKNVTLVAIMVHNHNWLRRLVIQYNGKILSKNEGHDVKMQEERLRWLEKPQPISAGDDFTALITGFYTSYNDWCVSWMPGLFN